MAEDQAPIRPAPDLALSEEFQLIDLLVSRFDAEGETELRQGEAPFQWDHVERLAAALSERTPDLRVGIWQLRAAMATSGLTGLTHVLTRIAGWLDLPEGQLQPHPEADETPTQRWGMILTWLGTPNFLHALAGLQIGEGQSSLTLRHLAEGGAPPPGQGRAVAELLATATQALTKIHAFLTASDDPAILTPGEAIQLLARAAQRLQGRAEPNPSAPDGAELPDSAPSPNGILQVRDRDDVHRALELLIDYFKSREPGHPAPIFLERVQRMLGASFEDLMRELYQEAPALLSRLQRPGQ